MEDSYIEHHSSGVAIFSGPEAVSVFQAVTIRSALRLLAIGIRPSRGYTIAKTLAAASRITGMPYRRSQIEEARRDLLVWSDMMRSELPTRGE
jgi:hypothetical protein